jgi:hypothetical protein
MLTSPFGTLLQKIIVEGIQEIQNQMVLWLQNNPVDPYIIRKLQPWGSQMYAYLSVMVCHCWIICH